MDNVSGGTPWIPASDNRFVLSGAEPTSATSVKWRLEHGNWVIDEINYPRA